MTKSSQAPIVDLARLRRHPSTPFALKSWAQRKGDPRFQFIAIKRWQRYHGFLMLRNGGGKLSLIREIAMTDSQGSLPTIISPDTQRGSAEDRTPPGQVLTAKWPVLHYGSALSVAPADWSLRIWGLVEREVVLDWEQFCALPRVQVQCDIHCVTHWSRLDNCFTGVATRTLLELAGPLPEAKFVIQHAPSDPNRSWTTNLPLASFMDEDCLLATHHDGQPLSDDHGAPVRAVVPRLYLWKGAKWITGIELVAEDKAGFWEQNGYHMFGDPWQEQRFSW